MTKRQVQQLTGVISEKEEEVTSTKKRYAQLKSEESESTREKKRLSDILAEVSVASGAFQAMYLLTNELYPSSIRAMAMGIASSIARVGLLVTPFVSQYPYNINAFAALSMYAGLSSISLFAIILLPIETTGRSLFSSMDELVVALRDARLRGNYGEVTFANNPSVNRMIRFFRWKATLDGMTIK